MNSTATLSRLQTTRYVTGFTHQLYRYPAAAPPDLVREIIEAYTKPGDLVVDPFMGGGTTIVEAVAQGRRALGIDANTLAVFVTRAKTTPLSAQAWRRLDEWMEGRPLRYAAPAGALDPRSAGLPYPLRRRLRSGLASLQDIDQLDARRLARCCLLRLAQWAVETQFGADSRDYVPGITHLEVKLNELMDQAAKGMAAFETAAAEHGIRKSSIVSSRTLRRASAWEDFVPDTLGDHLGKTRLVLTSPPYPGVHVLYHRWQVRSRKETAAPYWIANSQDGLGPAYYMMGGRSQLGQSHYFERLAIAFSHVRRLISRDGLVVQLVAFNHPEVQLPLFMDAMSAAGFVAAMSAEKVRTTMTREVANRRWYARGHESGSSREVLLIHRRR